MGGAWSNSGFLSNFLVRCYDKSSLHDLRKNGCARSYTAQTLWVEGSWVNFVFWSIFWQVIMNRSSLHNFFLQMC